MRIREKQSKVNFCVHYLHHTNNLKSILISFWCRWHDTIFFSPPPPPLSFLIFCHSFSCQCHDMVASARMSFARACSHALGSAIRKGLFMWCKFILTFSFLMLYLGGEINSFLSYLILIKT